jgi:hypothetical protein
MAATGIHFLANGVGLHVHGVQGNVRRVRTEANILCKSKFV